MTYLTNTVMIWRNIPPDSGLNLLFNRFPLRIFSSRTSCLNSPQLSLVSYPLLSISPLLRRSNQPVVVPLGTSVLTQGQPREQLCFSRITTPLDPRSLQTCLWRSTRQSWSSTVCALGIQRRSANLRRAIHNGGVTSIEDPQP
jgi:hypothetical protein